MIDTLRFVVEDQTVKADNGKLRLSLVPMQILKDVAKVREFGVEKYHDPENWKKVDKQRYIDAMLRHLLEWAENPDSMDKESGLSSFYHFECNVAFLSWILEQERKELEQLKREICHEQKRSRG